MWWFINKVDRSPFFASIGRFMMGTHDLVNPFFRKIKFRSSIVFLNILMLSISCFFIGWLTSEYFILSTILIIMSLCFLFLLILHFFWGFIEDFYLFCFYHELIESLLCFNRLYLSYEKKYGIRNIKKNMVIFDLMHSDDYQNLKIACLDTIQLVKNCPQVMDRLPKNTILILCDMEEKLITKELKIFDVSCIDGTVISIGLGVKKQTHYIKFG